MSSDYLRLDVTGSGLPINPPQPSGQVASDLDARTSRVACRWLKKWGVVTAGLLLEFGGAALALGSSKLSHHEDETKVLVGVGMMCGGFALGIVGAIFMPLRSV